MGLILLLALIPLLAVTLPRRGCQPTGLLSLLAIHDPPQSIDSRQTRNHYRL